MNVGHDPVTPLWRAAQVFRLLSYVYALWFFLTSRGEFERPGLGWCLFAVLTAWTALCGFAYVRGFGRRPIWVLAELGVVVALVMSTDVVASDQWARDNQAWPTTLWATNATISAALLLGPLAGTAAALAVLTGRAIAKGAIYIDVSGNATFVTEIAVGVVVGMAAQTARRVHAELERTARLAARIEERERLSRQVHDGVLQVLALVAKRGREIGGATSELAELAGQQERALRSFITDTDTAPEPLTRVDLGRVLRDKASERVSVSLPAAPVLIDAALASELGAAVDNALDNVRLHAGPGARAFLLLEDLGDAVTVSVRDNGPGIPEGRLDEAAREGRAGVSKSMVGRMNALGGSARVRTGPEIGTDWEFTVPCSRRHRT